MQQLSWHTYQKFGDTGRAYGRLRPSANGEPEMTVRGRRVEKEREKKKKVKGSGAAMDLDFPDKISGSGSFSGPWT